MLVFLLVVDCTRHEVSRLIQPQSMEKDFTTKKEERETLRKNAQNCKKESTEKKDEGIHADLYRVLPLVLVDSTLTIRALQPQTV